MIDNNDYSKKKKNIRLFIDKINSIDDNSVSIENIVSIKDNNSSLINDVDKNILKLSKKTKNKDLFIEKKQNKNEDFIKKKEEDINKKKKILLLLKSKNNLL